MLLSCTDLWPASASTSSARWLLCEDGWHHLSCAVWIMLDTSTINTPVQTASHTTKWPKRWRPWTQESRGPGWHTNRAPQGSPHHHHPRPGYPLQWPYPTRCPTQHEDREENTTRKEGQVQHHYEQPQGYNYHLNSGEDLRIHSDEQDRPPASVSPQIRIDRGPLPPNGSFVSHGIHIRSQSEQVLPGSRHTWFRESLRCGFSSYPLRILDLFKKGSAPDIWLAVKDMYEGISETVCWKNTYSRKYTIGQGVGQGKIPSPLLYKVYADNLQEKLEDSGLGVYMGTHSLDPPHAPTTSYLCPPKSQICKACSTSISHTLENDGTPYTP